MSNNSNLPSQLIARVKVKVCGMTQAKQVRELVDLGVDAIGVILHADSPRLVNVKQAQEIREQIPAFITMVGVFVDGDIDMVNDYIEQIGLDIVQLHGEENSEYASSINRPYIKAIRAKNADQVCRDSQQYPDSRALLIDPYVKGQHGGTGQQLEASVWPDSELQYTIEKKLILAGGLSKDNLLASVLRYQPFAVDLNSGVEDSPGIKNIALVSDCLAIFNR